MGKPRKKAGERADEEDRIQHGWHREHSIRLRFHPQQYTCNGCHERGYGFRYRCDFCSFDLHAACALAPAASWHPCHPQHALLLRRNSAGETRTCDICDQDFTGAIYSCSAEPDCDFDAHPTCLKLPSTTFHALHPQHRLDLYLPLPPPHAAVFGAAPPPDRLASCYVCRRNFKAGVASYSCATNACRFHIHVTCAKVPVDPFGQMRIPEASPHHMDFSTSASASTSASVSSDFVPSPSVDSGDEILEEEPEQPPPGPSVSATSVRSLQRLNGFTERLRCLGPG